MGKRYKCPYCEERLEKEKLISHVDEKHEDLIPENQTPRQVVFNSINKKTHGICVVCKRDTNWNEKAGKYNRLCNNPKCKEKLREEFKKNAMNKRGTYNFAADPKFQEKMLKGRKISSTYTFTDGGKIDYVGSYEKRFLEFIDKVMEINSKDIMAPGPTIPYKYNGETHYWITDFYYIPANLVLDIKDGGKNPNTRPMEEYREKQIAKELAIKNMKKYNYLRLTDNDFGQFMEVLADLKAMALDITQPQLITQINEAVIEEGYLKSDEDIYYNKDKFDSGEINLCFITGLSGSGKSTMGRGMQTKDIEHYELDDVICNNRFTMGNAKEYGDLIYSFFKGTGKKYKLDPDDKEYNKKIYNSYSNYEKEITISFVKYAISYAKSYKNKKYVCDGIWVFMFINPSMIKDCAVYIKGTSSSKSLYRAFKRDINNIKGYDDGSIKDILIRTKWLMYDVLDQKQYQTELKSFRSYFEKLTMNESYLVESSIQELSAGMSTVPPMYSADANVMITNNLAGERQVALSSLDFNDSLLIDDDEEGIKKISKKEFKENYSIKEQFLYHKNDKYYNLLEAFKNHTDDIYKGIYSNLSSFDNIIIESQIYFDKEFRQLANKGVDENIFELSKKIEKVNSALELNIYDDSIGITLPKMDLDKEYEVESILKNGKSTTRIKVDNSVIATFDKTAHDLNIKDYEKIEEAVNIIKGGIVDE